jgi:hypothetical protein
MSRAVKGEAYMVKRCKDVHIDLHNCRVHDAKCRASEAGSLKIPTATAQAV